MKPDVRAAFHLTFDDGPDPVWTPRVLDALRAADARATFFVSGPAVQERPEVVSATLAAGHGVELHCLRHVRHTQLSREESEEDAREALGVLGGLGIRPRLWRPPWGVLAPWTREVAAELGLEISLWNADTHDWRGDAADGMLEAVLPVAGPGSVVLMHDGIGPGALRTGCGETVALVPRLAEHARGLGCELEPLPPGAPAAAARLETTA